MTLSATEALERLQAGNAAVDAVLADPVIAHLVEAEGLAVRGAMYRTETGVVDFV